MQGKRSPVGKANWRKLPGVKPAYGRVLAQNVPKLTPIDVLPVDRSKLFQPDSPLLCLLITQGAVLRDLCRDYPQIRSFLAAVRLAINDEPQQGGQAGFTILATCLSRLCLQIFTGDREQTRAGTGGDLLKELLTRRLAVKSIGFLGTQHPRLPAEMVQSFGKALVATSPSASLPTDSADPFPLFDHLTYPPTVHAADGLVPTQKVLLHLILPHSLRCPADPYFTQVAMNYPHLHRSSGPDVVYGHYEDPSPSLQASRLHTDVQGNTHSFTGYRLIHWSPTLKPGPSNHMDLDTRTTALTIAAVVSFYTARSVRIDNESSKLLLLTPHNDSVSDLQDALGLHTPNYPPTLYDFYLACVYKKFLLKDNLACFPRSDRQRQNFLPKFHEVQPMEIHNWIVSHPELLPELHALATLETIVDIVHASPKGFTSYCTISNTVRAIGIGGSASLYFSVKMSPFLGQSREADARNLVALTRSKGLCALLLPSTHEHPDSALHALRTLRAFRHGIFHVGKDPIKVQLLAQFLTQPDVALLHADGLTVSTQAPFNQDSWLFTHQISYFGQWDFFPLALKLTFEGGDYIARASLKHDVPPANRSNMTPDKFEWTGTIAGGTRFSVVFGPDCLILRTQLHQLAVFPFPSPHQSPATLSDRGCTLAPTCGSHFFAQYSQSLGHLHPASPGVIDPDTHLRPLNVLKWPNQSPVITPLNLPMVDDPQAPLRTAPDFLPVAAIPLFNMGVERLCAPDILQDPTLNHAAWLTAYAALTADNFSPAMMSVLQHPSLPEEFKERVADPLQANDQLGVRHYLYDMSRTDVMVPTRFLSPPSFLLLLSSSLPLALFAFGPLPHYILLLKHRSLLLPYFHHLHPPCYLSRH